MTRQHRLFVALAAISLSGTVLAQAAAPAPANRETGPFSFFITSVGSGKGADLGGLEGADAHCQKLAAAVGAGNKTWRAYLSTQSWDGKPAVNARDRIGAGPWFNVKGTLVARSVSHLHGDTLEEARIGNALNWASALTENAKRARHPDGLATRRPCLRQRPRRPHLPQLHQQRRRRCRPGRSLRPHRWRAHRAVVELGPRQPWLQPAQAGEHWWRRLFLLLRCQVKQH